ALVAVEPRRLMKRRLVATAGGIELRDAGGGTLARHDGPVLLVSVGKAAPSMADGVIAAIGTRISSGFVLAPHGVTGDAPPGLLLRHGGHPAPDGAGASATEEILGAIAGVRAPTLMILALSGGASALLAAPAAGLMLEDEHALARRFLAAGADIGAFNTVRKHCSRAKGGGLARAASNAAGVWTLALSDVADDDLATIGSGPAVADPTTYADAEAILARYRAPGDGL